MLNYADSFSFLSNDNWDMTSYDGFDSTALSMYFALTSLSTTGFGDLYPVTDFERIVIAFMLLVGVAMFSYILGELRYMIHSIQLYNSDFEHKEKLEQFFAVLKNFNKGVMIESEIRNRIDKFLIEMWNNDKNNFLRTAHDYYLLD